MHLGGDGEDEHHEHHDIVGWAAICALAMSIFAVFSGSLRSSMVWFRASVEGEAGSQRSAIEGCGKNAASRDARDAIDPRREGGDGPFACSLVSSTGGRLECVRGGGHGSSVVETSRAARRRCDADPPRRAMGLTRRASRTRSDRSVGLLFYLSSGEDITASSPAAAPSPALAFATVLSDPRTVPPL